MDAITTTLSPYKNMALPVLLLIVVLILIIVSVVQIAKSSGNEDTRNELQKSVSILVGTNLAITIPLGALLYYYISTNPSALTPFTIIMLTFNLFLGILAVGVSTLQQLS
jgi:hypothetical protein